MTNTPFEQAFPLLKMGFQSKYAGNCKVCGRFVMPGEEVDYNEMLGGIVCARDCGRAYIV